VERGVNRSTKYIEAADGWIAHTWVIIALIALLSVPMLIMQIWMVRKIQRFQEERFNLIQSQQSPGDFRDPLATLL
jgi:hypothetical protein